MMISQSNHHHRPVKDIETYQREALSFLFAPESKDEMRRLHIPYAQLGFYSPMHFLSMIPEEMSEPYRNDKHFLASSGMVRKGDKVFILDKNSEDGFGILRSAIFRGRRIRSKTGIIEIILDEPHGTFREDEVIPYKEYLRQHLGTSLVPERDYVISPDGILQWEEPTWEPGQEVYYKPEKRWGVILSHETNTRGRNFALLQMDETPTKREKSARVPFNDLIVNSVPLRIPKRMPNMQNKQDSAMISSSLSGSGRSSIEMDDVSSPMNNNMTGTGSSNNRKATHGKTVHYNDAQESDEEVNRAAPPNRNMDTPIGGGTGEAIYAEVFPKSHEEIRRNKEMAPRHKTKGFSLIKSCLGRNPSISSSRRSPSQAYSRSTASPAPVPAPDYYLQRPTPPRTTEEEPISSTVTQTQQLQEQNNMKNDLKSKSYDDLNAPPKPNRSLSEVYDDIDFERHFAVIEYKNSLRRSARKIIQRQLSRTGSIKNPVTEEPRPHVAEIFTTKTETQTQTTQSQMPSQSQPRFHVEPVESEREPIRPLRSKHFLTETTAISTNTIDDFSKVIHQYSRQSSAPISTSALTSSSNLRPLSPISRARTPTTTNFSAFPYTSSYFSKSTSHQPS